MIIILFHPESLHHFFLCPFSTNDDVIFVFRLPPLFFFFFATSLRPLSQSDPANALTRGFHHLAGEITSGWHKRKKTMMGGHFRAKIISISGEESSLWQSRPLQFSVRPWWIPAGGTSVCKSFSLEILIIDPERKSLIMTSRQTAAAVFCWYYNNIQSCINTHTKTRKNTSGVISWKYQLHKCSFKFYKKCGGETLLTFEIAHARLPGRCVPDAGKWFLMIPCTELQLKCQSITGMSEVSRIQLTHKDPSSMWLEKLLNPLRPIFKISSSGRE